MPATGGASVGCDVASYIIAATAVGASPARDSPARQAPTTLPPKNSILYKNPFQCRPKFLRFGRKKGSMCSSER